MTRVHGGSLVERIDRSLKDEAEELTEVKVNKEKSKDIENIAHGVFSPLEGFMTRNNFDSVLDRMRLSNDVPWTVPVVLDVTKQKSKEFSVGDDITLTHNKPLAIMHVEEKYEFNKKEMAEKVYGTNDKKHPGVEKTYNMDDVLIAGKIDLIRDRNNRFEDYTLWPKETRVLFKEKDWDTVAGFQTRNAPHKGHEYVQKTALAFVDGIFVNPVIGKKKEGDFKDQVIIDAYNELMNNYYVKDTATLSIFRTEMRYAGPREAVFHSIARKNFGCTHFIVGRDHAGVGDYYDPYEAHRIFEEFPDLGITPLFFRSFFHCDKCGGVVNEKTCPHGNDHRTTFSGTKIRGMLKNGKKPSDTFMRPEVSTEVLQHEEPFVQSE